MNKTSVFVLLLAISLIRCANPIPPSGGEDDMQGPRLRTESSTPNFQTNFTPEEIILTFDEWVQLKSANDQILISPPLAFKPTIKHRGKEVRIILDPEEVLRTNTTYSIQFGEAIQDITENNPTEDLRFVFSTGPKLDSLSISGRLLGLDQQTPVADAMVFLYDGAADSLPFTQRPAYTAKTNDQGIFSIEYLRPDTFKIVALQDENRNYLVDPDRESMAFLNDQLVLTDSSAPKPELIMYKEVPSFRWSHKDLNADHLVLAWRGSQDTSDFYFQNPLDLKLKETIGDSIIYWLNTMPDSVVILKRTDTLPDTLIIKPSRKSRKDTTMISLNKSAMYKPVLTATDTLFFYFDRPITSFNPAMFIYSDTLQSVPVSQVIQTDHRSLALLHDWSLSMESSVSLYPEAIIPISGKEQMDTIIHRFVVPKKEKISSLILNLESSDSTTQFIVSLKSGEKHYKKMVLPKGLTQKEFVVKPLRPGKYELEIVEDTNQNGRWDTGSYWLGRQPEKRWKKELEPLRENWDLKVNLKL